MTETVAEILDAYRAGAAKPEDIVARSFARIRAHNDPAIFIALREEAEVLAEAREARARRRQGRFRFTASRLRSRTISTSRACRPPRRARLTAIARQETPPPSRGCARPARSFSARPISTSSRPVSSACARPTAFRAICSMPKLIPGGSSSGSALAVGAGHHAARARHRYGRIGPRAGRVQQYRRAQAEPRPRFHRRRRARLPHARLRFGLRADGRRCDDDADGDRRRRSRRSVFASAAGARARTDAGRPEARRAARRASACSSATAPRRRPTTAALARFRRARRRRSSRSTSSRSTRRRGFFTRGRGSPSVISPCARSLLRRRNPCIR